MKLLLLSYEPGYEPASYSSFGSDTSILDYDVVLWDPAEVLSDYVYDSRDDVLRDGYYRGLPTLGPSGSAKIMADLARRRKEILEFLELGRTLFVVVRPPQDFYFDTGKRQYSGTGKNQKTTTIVQQNSVLTAALPLSVSVQGASGNRIEYVGPDGAFAAFWREQKTVLCYQGYLEGDYGTPLWRVTGTTRVLGSHVATKGGGSVVFLPAPLFPGLEVKSTKHKAAEQASAFQQAILDLASSLRADGGDISVPDWASEYLLPGEHVEIVEAQQLELGVQAARTRAQEAAARLRTHQADKLLFVGTGRPLELRVRAVLEALGGSVMDPEPGRDDWLVDFPEGPAVVEIKGVAASAAEKHAAQLEKWVSSYFEEHGKTPKGILVVNGWRGIPLDERSEPVFPDQMLPYSTARNHCLITGVQLLGIACEIEQDPGRAGAMRKSVLDTVGVYVGHDDWRSFMSIAQREEVTEARRCDVDDVASGNDESERASGDETE